MVTARGRVTRVDLEVLDLVEKNVLTRQINLQNIFFSKLNLFLLHC